jgi:hypothetical protein
MLLKNINRPTEKRGQVLGLGEELLLKDSNNPTEKGKQSLGVVEEELLLLVKRQ